MRPTPLRLLRSPIALRALLGLLALSAFTLTPSGAVSVAEAKKPEAAYLVRYSYERQSRLTEGGLQKSYVLMPRGVEMPLEDYQDKKKRFRVLFDELKGAKRNNYGKVGFNTKDDERVVLVFLDESKASNHPFVMAEVIYTFIEAGAAHVEFPKSPFAGKAYKKSDVSYPAYQLTLPYWEGLPPRKLTGGLLSFSDGSLVTAAALLERLKSKDKELMGHLNASLESADLEAVRAIVAAQEALRSAEPAVLLSPIASGLTGLLNSASEELRRLALTGLVGLNSAEVDQRLLQVMDSDPSEALKAKAAGLLSESKDPIMAEKAQFFALRSSDKGAIIAAAKGLAKAKVKEATAELLKVLSHDDAEVRAAVISALVTRKAQGELLSALKGELALVAKIDVAEALIQDKSASTKTSAYELLIRQPNAAAAARAARALAKEKKFKPTLELLTELLKHSEAEARLAAIEALTEIGGKGARAALAEADLKDQNTGRAAYEAMRTLYERELKVVLKEAASQKSLALQAAATSQLGVVFKKRKRDQKKAFAQAKNASTSKRPELRAEAARSFGEMGTEDALSALMELAKDEAVEVKRLVALALRHDSEERARPVLLERLKDDDAETLVNALDSLGLLASTESLAQLRNDRFLKHEQASVRAAVVGALIGLAPQLDEKARLGVVARLEPMFKDSDLEVQLRVARLMGAIPSSDSEFHLAAHMQSGGKALTLEIIKALVQHDTGTATESLKSAVEIDDKEVRRFTYELGAQLKSPEAKEAFEKVLARALERESDEELKALLTKLTGR